MCGIGGIISRCGKAIRPLELSQMMEAVNHRGPDGKGEYFDGCLGLGHRRLAIVDLSDDGHQPMTYDGDSLIITYNGEIYNYIELKARLEKDGFFFCSGTDTEVILAAYKKWGKNCVRYFNGMWAFAIYDRQKQEIFCSRDRFGIKPFFYTVTRDVFMFASEIKQFSAAGVPLRVNEQALMDFLVLGLSEHSNKTFFSGISSLQGGHNLIYDLQTSEFQIRRYYWLSLDKSLVSCAPEEGIEMYSRLFHDSVALRLRSDVKVGTCLSGGLDSSSVAAIASGLYGENFNAITASSLEAANNEVEFARSVVEGHGLQWSIVEPNDLDFMEKVIRMVGNQDEPVSDPSLLMQDMVFAKSSELGCKVLLDGQGGDETLLGYERYFPALLLQGTIGEKLQILRQFSSNSRLTLPGMLAYSGYFLLPFLRRKKLIHKNSFLKPLYVDLVNWSLVDDLAMHYRDIHSLQMTELSSTQLPHLLRYEDRNSMAHSIETRLPFLDYRLVECALSLPLSLKLKDGWSKYVLRKTVADVLPDEIVWRKNKIGFEAPAGLWQDNNKVVMQKVINDSPLLNTICRNVNDIKSGNQWRYFFVALWEKIYGVCV